MPSDKDPYSRQKRYNRRRYAQDAEFNRAHRQRMREYARDQYANNAAFKRRQQASQRDWYARQAALLSVRHLFEAPPARRHRTPRSVDNRILQFCWSFLAGSPTCQY